MCDDRKLEGVGVVGHVVGIHFGWDPADHFGNPRSVQQGLASTSLDCEYMCIGPSCFFTMYAHKQTSTWQKPKIGFVQFGSRVK